VQAKFLTRILALPDDAQKVYFPFSLELMQVLQVFQQFPNSAWMEIDLTMPQFKVLLLLYANDNLTMTTISSRLQVSVPTASGLVDRLVRHSLVEREEDPHDRRVVRIRLTEQGQDVFNRLFRANTEIVNEIVSRLSVEDQNALQRGLLAMIRASRDCLAERERSASAPGEVEPIPLEVQA
jgi:DNA-binding MarR family transcriptional regulator